MKTLAILAALAVSAFGQGTSVPTGTWTQITPGGYRYEIVGFDQSTWVSSRNCAAMWVNYSSTSGITSEAQDSLVCYNYAENFNKVLYMTGAWHSTHSPGTGHPWAGITYDSDRDALYTAIAVGQGPELNYDLYQYDVGGLVGSVRPPPANNATANPTKRVWARNNLLNFSATYDPFNHKYFTFANWQDANGRASVCDMAAQTCVSSTNTGGPLVAGYDQWPLKYNPDDHTIWIYDGGNVWNYNIATDTWTHPTTTCVGVDCVIGVPSSNPPSRLYGAMEYSTADKVFLLMGGTDGLHGTPRTDTWTLDPVTLIWTELCNSCGYANNNVNTTFNRLSYDTQSNVFMYFSQPSGLWLYAITTPLNYGRTPVTYVPTAGAITRTVPSSTPGSTAQDIVFDLQASTDGTNLFVIASQTDVPANFAGPCAGPVPYLWSSAGGGSYLPSGAQSTACAAIDINGVRPTSHPYHATVNGVEWVAFERHSFQGNTASSLSFAYTYNGSTYDGGSTGVCNTAPSGGNTTVTATSGTFTAAEAGTLISIAGTQYIIATFTDSTHVTVQGTGPGTQTGAAWFIAPIGCFTNTCIFNGPIMSRPQGLVAAGTTPTIAVLEQNSNTDPHQNNLWVAQFSGGVWASLGAAKLNITSASEAMYAAIAATAANNVAACWTEETNSDRTTMATTPQLFCSLWNGSSWSRMFAGSLNISSTSFALSPFVLNLGGTWYVAWAEQTQTGPARIYVKVYNPGSDTWSLVGSNPLNVDTSSGIAYHPTLATDGTNIFAAWEEQSNKGLRALGYMKKWNGSNWNQIGGPIAADLSNGSVADLGIVYAGTTLYAAWTELLYGNLRQIYYRSLPPFDLWPLPSPISRE